MEAETKSDTKDNLSDQIKEKRVGVNYQSTRYAGSDQNTLSSLVSMSSFGKYLEIIA